MHLLPVSLMVGGLVASSAPGAGDGARPARAMWMWASKGTIAVLSDRDAWPEFFAFCTAPHGRPEAGLSTIYLEPPREAAAETRRAFVAAAHQRGLRVEWLWGDGDWQAGHLEGAKSACQRLLEELSTAPAEERFDGVHLDLENKGRWSQRAFRELLTFLRQRLDAYNRGAARPMTLAADLGFHWAEAGGDGAPQYPDALLRCDYVVCMAYRDTAGAQASCAVPQALAARKADKPFFVGAETMHLPDEDFVTYYQEGWEFMEGELAKLPGLLTQHGGRLDGIAIHHYDSYRALPRERRQSPFQDVRLDFWAYPQIMAAVEARLVSGYPGGWFLPKQPVSRDQMAVFLARVAAGRPDPPPAPTEASFPDVPRDHWAFPYVEYVSAQGIAQGYPDGGYHPEEIVNRGQMAVFIARATALPRGEAGLAGFSPPAATSFPDVTPEGPWVWCHRHVELTVARGIVQGYPDGCYHPELPCTRDQMVVYVLKAMGVAA